ncbi:uncharacterized protein A4U43_C09F5620 [Asparagus officinalis]|uniref:Uncharacterized protein n=1 Tax=Asparagus officinalis TaxID=4686 RepID=A0A5P1E631_ASPOF|nr:uncharacterized protein A4U43_C09F5620 [Asparagus officinalis]
MRKPELRNGRYLVFSKPCFNCSILSSNQLPSASNGEGLELGEGRGWMWKSWLEEEKGVDGEISSSAARSHGGGVGSGEGKGVDGAHGRVCVVARVGEISGRAATVSWRALGWVAGAGAGAGEETRGAA